MPTASPLISIIVRTVGRKELEEALASLAKQSYTSIETLVVDALGDGIPLLDSIAAAPGQKVLSDGKQHDRSSAGNIGLDAATGDFALFLDDDDWIGEDHLTRLFTELLARPNCIAVYSSTQKTTKDGSLLDEFFAEEFRLPVLRRDNFMPIHSVLFRRSAIDRGCRFDSTLAIYEDWDFWLQLASEGEFEHIPSISAFYRGGGDSETPVDAAEEKYAATSANAKAREKVLAKWAPTWTASELNAVFGSLDKSDEIQELQRALTAAQAEYTEQLTLHTEARIELEHAFNSERAHFESARAGFESERAGFESERAAYGRERGLLKAQLQDFEESRDALRDHLDAMQASFSWRVTKPYRFLSGAVKRILKPESQHQAVIPEKVITSTQQPSEQSIKASIDLPRLSSNDEPALCSGDLTIEGWAFSSTSDVTVSISINGNLYRETSPALPRTDVAATFPRIEGAKQAGFREVIDSKYLPSGLLALTFTVSCGEESLTLERSLIALSPALLYRHWANERWPEQVSDAPTSTGVAVIPFESGASVEDLFDALRCAAHDGKDLLLLSAEETLRADALSRLRQERAACNADLVYSDHDTVDAELTHANPEFTFGWSPEHLLARNYIGGVFLFSSELFKRIDEPALLASIVDVLETEPCAYASVRYRLLLALGAMAERVSRVPEVLWTTQAEPRTDTIGESLWAQNFLESAPFSATVREEQAPTDGHPPLRAIDRVIAGTPLVSIIIPTMAKLALIQPCLESLFAKTEYAHFEVIILDNSRGKFPEGIAYLATQSVTVIECDFDFNWPKLNNLGVEHSKGDYLLFLNDDVEIIYGDWLAELVKQAQRPEVGAVGAMLYYAERKIQHAGVLLVNHGGGAMHLFHKLAPSDSLFGQLHKIPREVSANTGACLMVSREKFLAVQGFDEELVVVGNDIDLCLKFLEQGLVNIWTPRSALIHHESISRKASAPKADEQKMWDRWGRVFESGDRYYNPNLTLHDVDCAASLTLAPASLTSVASSFGDTQTTEQNAQTARRAGVNLVGYIRAEMGLGEAARSDARAFEAAGVDFGILNFERGNSARMGDRSWANKERNDAPYDMTLWHINADHLAFAQLCVPRYLVAGSYSIAYWAWELETLPEAWIPVLDSVDEVWTPSQFVCDAVAKVTEKPVVCLPHCVEPAPLSSMNRAYFGLPKEPYLFLSMYDTRSVAERKNPKAALAAFLGAFDRQDGRAALVLKINNATAESMEELLREIGDRRDVILLHGDHSKVEIDSLINAVDCYVSLHRSEGFGLAPAEAMSLGKAAIVTNWSGSTDYTHSDHCLPIDYTLITLDQDYGPYKKGQRWAEPSIEQASMAMSKLVAEPAFARELGIKARDFIAAHFSPAAVGAQMRARLDTIRAQRNS